MDKKLVRNLGAWTLVFGILTMLFYMLHDIVGAMHYPGYDPMTQAVSDLTAADAPSYTVASGYTKVYGIFSCLCNVFVCLLMRDHKKPLRIGIYLITAMNFTSAVGYALFPLTGSGYDGSFQSFVHVYVITAIVVLLSIVSLIFIAAGNNLCRIIGIPAYDRKDLIHDCLRVKKKFQCHITPFLYLIRENYVIQSFFF